ncbi:MAG: GNAT family N-acetyltransferase [Rikenellaceae bacterium]|nr:GNAT family N-acetyltransferase [Rikenellaceae bacterium]
MIFREASGDDIPGLYEVWTTCFTDDYSYIDNFFKHCFPHTRSLVATTDSGEIASSITLIPATVQIKYEIIKGYYLYAVGTKLKHRGFSLSSALIDIAKQICRDENLSFLITRPASESLYDLYKRYGFCRTLYEEELIEPLDNQDTLLTEDISISPLSLDNFERIRNASGNKFLWSREILNYVLLETAERGGFNMFLENRENISESNYFIAYPEPDFSKTILVLETNFKESNYSFLYKSIRQLYPQASAIKIIRPNNSGTVPKKLKQSGLLFPIRKESDNTFDNFSIMLPLE